MKRRTLEVTTELASMPLDRLVSMQLPVPLSDARALIEGGAVYLNGRRCTLPLQTVCVGERIGVVISEGAHSALTPTQTQPEPRILHDHDGLLAFDKPSGMTTQPTEARAGESLWDWAKARFGPHVSLVHRLDRETSGVVAFGRDAAVGALLSEQFRLRRVRKTYLALTATGLPERGEITLPISKDPTRPGRQRASAQANGQAAHTDYERCFELPDRAGVALAPRTGRTHQLRAHLTAIGFPIVGDRLYGGFTTLGGERIDRCLLHARRLVLQGPTGQVVTLEAELPADLQRFWQGACP